MNVQWYLPWMPAVVPQQQPQPQPQPQMVTAAQQYMQQQLLKQQQQQLIQQQQNYLATAGFLQPQFFNPNVAATAAGFAAQPQLLAAKAPLLRTPQSLMNTNNTKVRRTLLK